MDSRFRGNDRRHGYSSSYFRLIRLTTSGSVTVVLENNTTILADSSTVYPALFKLLFIGWDSVLKCTDVLGQEVTAMGGAYNICNGTTASAADLVGIDAVFMTAYSQLDSASLAYLETCSVPAVVSDVNLQIRMGMSDSSATDTTLTHAENTANISVSDSSHPILTGCGYTNYQVVNVMILTPPHGLAWGEPHLSTAMIAAEGVVSPNHCMIYTYETGDTMVSGTAPARRAGFFVKDATLLTSDGKQLLRNTIDWARGKR